MGAATQQEIEMMNRDTEQADSLDGSVDDMGRRGQILWLRGITRLQHQVCPQHSRCCCSLVILTCCHATAVLLLHVVCSCVVAPSHPNFSQAAASFIILDFVCIINEKEARSTTLTQKKGIARSPSVYLFSVMCYFLHQ